jgi:hypothetical protein
MMGYDDERIAQELEQTAQGCAYYGNALYVAMDIPVADEADKRMLHRYLHGSELLTDRFLLQDLAIKIRKQRHGAEGE